MQWNSPLVILLYIPCHKEMKPTLTIIEISVWHKGTRTQQAQIRTMHKCSFLFPGESVVSKWVKIHLKIIRLTEAKLSSQLTYSY